MKRALAGFGVLAVAVAIMAFPPQPTLASWSDTEYSRGGFSASLARPTILTCTSKNILGAGEVAITWSYPTTIAASPAPTPTFYFSSSTLLNLTPILGSTVTTTGPVGGVYTTKYGSTVLSGLLGGTVYVGVATTQGTWLSTPASATAALPAVIGIGTCTIN